MNGIKRWICTMLRGGCWYLMVCFWNELKGGQRCTYCMIFFLGESHFGHVVLEDWSLEVLVETAEIVSEKEAIFDKLPDILFGWGFFEEAQYLKINWVFHFLFAFRYRRYRYLIYICLQIKILLIIFVLN